MGISCGYFNSFFVVLEGFVILNCWQYQEKEEQLDGDAGLNKLFRDIYQNADEDMRRAMTKSFVSDHFKNHLLCISVLLRVLQFHALSLSAA